MKCLFCGKPLSRMSLRREGDFCCREHRDRYHLRQGLNRLQEAHELTTLSRRRECPTAARLDRRPQPGPCEARACGGKRPAARRKPADCFLPALRVARPPRLGHGTLAGDHEAHQPEAQPRTAPAPPIRPRLSWRPLEQRRRKATPRFASFERVSESCGAGDAAARMAGTRQTAGTPPALARLQVALRRAELPGATFVQQRAPAVLNGGEQRKAPPMGPLAFTALPFPGEAGAELRLPRGLMQAAAKPITSWASPVAAKRRAAAPLAFRWPGNTFAAIDSLSLAGGMAGLRHADDYCRPGLDRTHSEPRRTAEVAWKARSPECPAPKRPPRAPRAVVAGTVSRIAPSQDQQRSPRRVVPAPATWVDRLETTLPPALVTDVPGARRPASATYCMLPPLIASGPCVPRGADIPFTPDKPEISPITLDVRGTCAGTFEDARTRTPFQLEDSFSAGLGRWVGGSDWRLDAAGVRPCSLALFGPSLGARDYVIEFLAKVEQGGIRWAFRAADLENYYSMKIALTAGQEFELSRRAVVAGAAEPAVKIPLKVKIRSRSAFRVTTRVSGNEFVTELDGQTVDHWRDDRIAAGGIGFEAAREARARLYWVKLSSPETKANMSTERPDAGLE